MIKKHICVGLLAHVDAGKTTLSEGMLYLSGSIRRLGRVDHGDAFLDTFELERERGITIFSKQASLSWKGTELTLLDTPGHVDFSAEMERTLQVLDCAVLVISALDGVQGHTETLWRLLARYRIPVFLFINKMDQDGADRTAVLEELKKRFGDGIVDFSPVGGGRLDEESLAVCDERLLEEYLETGTLADESLADAISERKIFPCWFGSALKAEGISELLDGIASYRKQPEYPETFGAKVYKIARDAQGNRLTYLKVTGGILKVREMLPGTEEKINQIRMYSGAKYETVQEVPAGYVCAVTGPEHTFPGQGLGIQKESELPVLEPVLTYRIVLPDECDVHTMLRSLRQLEEEEPELHIVWEEALGEIHAQIMGEVQIEVLRRLIKERFGVSVEFGEGSIVYKETIASETEGVGHFEPLRHYAEVHLLLEPGERGSGMQFLSDCSEDVLDRNWQRLILTHLEEKEHRGVLTGAPVTDIRITLISGRAHQKHTEGGDFRQATYRAVRQGLKKAESVLLEPYYEFRMELPSAQIGRAMTDIQKRSGSFDTPQTDGELSVLTGTVPVSEMRGYQTEFASYTGGRGRLFCTLRGYDVCHDQERIVEEKGYDSEADLDNPTSSVFCAHGAGFVVPWDEVEDYMHLESGLEKGIPQEELMEMSARRPRASRIELTQEELDAIYVRTPDPVRRKENPSSVTVRAGEGTTGSDEAENRNGPRGGETGSAGQNSLRRNSSRAGGHAGVGKGTASSDQKPSYKKKEEQMEEYLLVDGYNIIFAWEELNDLAKRDIGAARGKLMDILSNYQGIRGCTLILVFDAYKVEGNPGETTKYHNIYVVYTKEAETADQYIEKTVRRIAKKHEVTVATSDALEQVIILGEGAGRMSAAGLKEEIELAVREIRGEHLSKTNRLGNYLFDYLDEEDAAEMERTRLGKQKKQEN